MIYRQGLAAVLLPVLAWAGSGAAAVPELQRNGNAMIGTLPLLFEANRGQSDQAAGFLSHTDGYQLAFAADGVTFSFPGKNGAVDVHMALDGADRGARLVGEEEIPAKTNYLFGKDASRWVRQVPNYQRIKVKSALPGVDVSYYGNGHQLEYDLELAAGADPGKIALRFSGARRIRLSDKGDLTVATREGAVSLRRPLAYQVLGGNSETAGAVKVPVEAAFVLGAHDRVGFRLGAYDHSRPLVIDPVVSYVSYFSGTYVGPEPPGSLIQIMGMATDNAGFTYLYGYDPGKRLGAGATTLASCPAGGCVNVFIMKFNPNASGAAGLVFTTLIPAVAAEDLTTAPILNGLQYGAYGLYGAITGSFGNNAFYPSYALSLDSSGNIYITGGTDNPDFPTTAGAYATTCTMNPDDPILQFCVPAAYVSKLSPDGSTMLYSTYLNSAPPSPYPPFSVAKPDVLYPAFGYGIVADDAQIAYVAAMTTNGFPVTNGLPCKISSPPCASVSLLKLDTTKTGAAALIYSEGFNLGTQTTAFNGPTTFLATDGAGALYSAQPVCYAYQAALGLTPTTPNGYDTVQPAPAPCISLFKLDPAGKVVYSTYFSPFSGSNYQTLLLGGVAADRSGLAYLTGVVAPDTALPIVGNGNLFTVPDAATSGHAAEFVVGFDTTQTGASSLVYSTGIEGIQAQTRTQIASDGCGSIAITGQIESTAFPFVNPIAGAVQSPGGTLWPPFAAIFNTNLSGAAGLTFASSMFTNVVNQVTLTNLNLNLQGNLALAGFLQNDPIPADYVSFPTVNAFQTTPSMPANTNPEPYFQALKGAIPPGCINLAPATLAFGSEQVGLTTSSQTVTVTNMSEVSLSLTNIVASSGYAVSSACPASLAPKKSCTVSASFAPLAAGTNNGTLTFTDSDFSSPQVLTLTGVGTSNIPATPVVGLSPTTLAFPNTTVGQTAPAQTITVTNSGTAATTLAISVIGAGAADFPEQSTCGATLAAGANCAITVTFSPHSAVAYSASIQLVDTAANSPQTVSLTGTGIAAPVPQVSLTPGSLMFAGTTVGATSASQTETLTNTGTVPLAISAINLVGTNPQDFSQASSCGATLAVGASCTITVSFTPSAAAGFSASLQISDNAASAVQTATLSGSGTAATAPNFTVSSTTPTQTVQSGSSASFDVVVTPTNGTFSSPVSFSASGQPPGATVTFTPATVTPGAGPATTTMTVTTASGATASVLPAAPWQRAPEYLAIAFGIPLSFRASARNRRVGRPRLRHRLWRACVLGAAAAAILVGCGGGGFKLPAAAGTPTTNTYLITVTATSGSDVQTTSVTLMVHP